MAAMFMSDEESHDRLKAMIVGREGITPKQLQFMLADLRPTCLGRPCPCQQLAMHSISASYWDASQPGYSRVHTEVSELLPHAAAVF
jgi:hypothetical protein